MPLTTQATALRLHPLTYLVEGDEVVVGRMDTDSYGLFPADGAELLQRLEAGMSTTAAQVWYEQRYGEPVDIDEFLDTLRELDFVAADDAPFAAEHTVRWQRLGRALFSPVAWIAYAMLVVAAVAACIDQPRLVPSPRNAFFTHYLVIVELTLSVVQIPMLMLHEAFHVLAGRRLGLNSSVHIGRRLYFLVFETKLDGLVVVPRRKRFLPILAGMLIDFIGMCALTVVAWYSLRPDGSLPLYGAFCLALAFTAVPRIGGQFYFFLRTDVYQLVVTILGCVDLHSTAKEIMANRFWALAKRPHRIVDSTHWHPTDIRVARWYGPLFVAGYAVMIAMLIGITVPLAWRFFSTAIHTLTTSSATSGAFIDAAILMSMTGLQLGIVAVLAIRKRLRARATRAQ